MCMIFSVFQGSHPKVKTEPVIGSTPAANHASHSSDANRKSSVDADDSAEQSSVHDPSDAKHESSSKRDNSDSESNESAGVSDGSAFDADIHDHYDYYYYDDGHADDDRYYYYEYAPIADGPPQAHHHSRFQMRDHLYSHSVPVPNNDEYYYYYYDDDEPYHYSSSSKARIDSKSDSQKHESGDQSPMEEKPSVTVPPEVRAKESANDGKIGGSEDGRKVERKDDSSGVNEDDEKTVHSESTPVLSAKHSSFRNYPMLLVIVAVVSSIASLVFYEITRRVCKGSLLQRVCFCCLRDMKYETVTKHSDLSITDVDEDLQQRKDFELDVNSVELLDSDILSIGNAHGCREKVSQMDDEEQGMDDGMKGPLVMDVDVLPIINAFGAFTDANQEQKDEEDGTSFVFSADQRQMKNVKIITH